MRIPKLRDWLLPLMILGFVGIPVSFLGPVFNTSSRWLFLALMAVYLLLKGGGFRTGGTAFERFTLLFWCWALLTVTWSEVPSLTAMKATAFGAVVFVGMAAGRMWVRNHPREYALNYLLPLTIAALLAGILGKYSAAAFIDTGVSHLYQGLVAGPNMFGSLLAMVFPLLLWKTYSLWSYQRQRIVCLMLVGIDIYYLLAANSRGAILVVLFTLAGLLMTLPMRRRMRAGGLLLGTLAALLVTSPGALETAKRKFIHKEATEEQGIFYTREAVWAESYELAKAGGWFGGGYGVTIGDATFTGFKGGLTSVGYGREKGSTQLALAEETGLVGLAIYSASIFALFISLARSVSRLREKNEKALMGVVVGALFGMCVQSIFEAWWVAPASPESVYFWVLVGVTLALSGRAGLASRSGATQSVAGLHIRPAEQL